MENKEILGTLLSGTQEGEKITGEGQVRERCVREWKVQGKK